MLTSNVNLTSSSETIVSQLNEVIPDFSVLNGLIPDFDGLNEVIPDFSVLNEVIPDLSVFDPLAPTGSSLDVSTLLDVIESPLTLPVVLELLPLDLDLQALTGISMDFTEAFGDFLGDLDSSILFDLPTTSEMI